MQELDNLIEKLNNDNYSAISVFDLESQSFLYRNLIHAEIMTQFGSGEDFFETLFENGNRRLRLTLKRKNGSTYKLDGQPFEVNFSPKIETVKPVETLPVIAPIPVQELVPNSFGLGTLDIMNLMVSKNDAQRLFTENEVLKSENKEQKKLIEELKEERLASKYNTEKSKGNQEMLLGAIQQLPTLVSFVKGQPLPTGLNAPQSELSEAKQHFAKALQNIDDTILNVLSSINDGLNTNVEFSNELAELLKKHQLWEA